MKKNLLLFLLSLFYCLPGSAQSQQQLWGIVDGVPFHVDLKGENLSLINGDTTGTGRQVSNLRVGDNGYVYGTTTTNITDTRQIFKIHKDSSAIHEVIRLKRGSRILGLAIDGSTIFGSLLDEPSSLHYIFSVDDDGQNFSILYRFSQGQWINGTLVLDDEFIYGTQGVGAGQGTYTVFRLYKNGAVFQPLITLSGSPATPLLLTREGELVWVSTAPSHFNNKEIYKIAKSGGNFGVLGYFTTEEPDINSLIETRDGEIFGSFTMAGYPRVRYIFRLETNRFGFAELVTITDNSWVPGGAFFELSDGRLLSESRYGGVLLFFSPDNNAQEFRPTGNLTSIQDIGSDGKLFGVADGDYYGPPAKIYSANPDGSQYKVIYANFGVSEVGSNTVDLIAGPDGNVYGTNVRGGANTIGTVFKISPQGITKIFDNGDPSVGPIFAHSDGYLYSHNSNMSGCTNLLLFRIRSAGGGLETNCVKQYPFSSAGPIELSTGEMVGVSPVGNGSGFMYRLRPDLGGMDVLRSFSRETGKQPVGKLIEGKNGYLYGVNLSGGIYNLGGVFRVKPDGTDYQLLVHFDGKNGWSTNTSLVQHPDGTIYGVIPQYNAKKGFVFSIQPDGSDYKVAINFTSPELVGISPGARLLMDAAGRLYNNASRGSETFIYAINPDGQGFQKIMTGPGVPAFISSTTAPSIVQVTQPVDRATGISVKPTFMITPVEFASEYTLELSTTMDFNTIVLTKTTSSPSVEVVGLEYGTTYYTRVRTDLWPTFGPITRFRTQDGQLRFWGVTSTGGTGSNGTIFSISTEGTSFLKYHDYDEDYNVANLHDKLIPVGDNYTIIGYSVPAKDVSSNTLGELFKINVDGTGFEVLKEDGLSYGGLMKTSTNTFYYADSWASYWKGAIFNFESPDDEWARRYSFNGINGMNPVSSLLEHDGYLYGMTRRGGANNGNGVIYRLRINDHAFEKIHDFTKEFGKNPEGSLIDGANGFLYGMTTSGGSANYGSIFRIKPDGSEFRKLHDFNIANGRMPLGDLVLAGGRLFGMTSLGGKFKFGVIFRINRDGSGYTILHHFSGIDGAEPLKNLVAYKGYLFGMTSKGGSNGLGVIFKIKVDGTEFAKLFDFNWGTGGAPDGSLTLIPTPLPMTAQSASAELAEIEVEGSARQISIDAYPNPFTETLYINVDGEEGDEFTSTLMDLTGKTVSSYVGHVGHTNTPTEIKTDISAGLYLLKVKIGSVTRMIRVVRK